MGLPIAITGGVSNDNVGKVIADQCRLAEQSEHSHPRGENVLLWLEKDWHWNVGGHGLDVLNDTIDSARELLQRGVVKLNMRIPHQWPSRTKIKIIFYMFIHLHPKLNLIFNYFHLKMMRKNINFVALGFVFVCGLMWIRGDSQSWQHRSITMRAKTNQKWTPTDCKLVKYVPSSWESTWLADVDDLAAREAMCASMQASGDLSKQWLAGVAACKQDSATCWPALSKRVFSKFVKECSPAGPAGGLRSGGAGRGVLVEEFIEPLVGHMRHPFGLPACTPPSVSPVNVQDRSYLMLLGDGSAAVRARYPGRAILFDAGTNKYASSLGYLIPAYAEIGIQFDAVYAWEYTPADPSQYWASVPADVKPRLHFYNAPVTPQPGSAMNPVDWIRELYQPGDYIVFKLDIDNDVVEGELIQQVLDMEGAGDMIAEMFFEKHYSAADMKKHFGDPETQYPTALRLMHELRAKGVRVHYWP